MNNRPGQPNGFPKFSQAYEYQAFRLLQLLFVITFFLKGMDKIYYSLVGHSHLETPVFSKLLPGNDYHFMLGVGIAELIIGFGLIFKPKYFAYLAMVWMVVIIVYLLSLSELYDVVLREIVLFFAALSLAKLSYKYGN